MNARDELAAVIVEAYGESPDLCPCEQDLDVADHILAAGYAKPRTIRTAAELEALPFGSAVQTSDDSDTVVLRAEGQLFRNQTGADLTATDLWRFGTRPFTVIYEPEPTALTPALTSPPSSPWSGSSRPDSTPYWGSRTGQAGKGGPSTPPPSAKHWRQPHDRRAHAHTRHTDARRA